MGCSYMPDECMSRSHHFMANRRWGVHICQMNVCYVVIPSWPIVDLLICVLRFKSTLRWYVIANEGLFGLISLAYSTVAHSLNLLQGACSKYLSRNFLYINLLISKQHSKNRSEMILNDILVFDIQSLNDIWVDIQSLRLRHVYILHLFMKKTKWKMDILLLTQQYIDSSILWCSTLWTSPITSDGNDSFFKWNYTKKTYMIIDICYSPITSVDCLIP